MNIHPHKTRADPLVYHAVIYTVDQRFSKAGAMVVKDGHVVFTGVEDEARRLFECQDELDVGGRPVYPGFIDPHCHFLPYGLQLDQVDLTGADAMETCVQRLREQANGQPWILGHGWDHQKWSHPVLPHKRMLDAHFPNRPVLMMRIDRHCAVVNSAALQLAGISRDTVIEGGVVDVADGDTTGILLDAAIDRVLDAKPENTPGDHASALLRAQAQTHAVGLTSVGDALTHLDELLLVDELQREGKLKTNFYAMVVPDRESREYFKRKGPWTTDLLTATSFKYFTDGALGSGGAAMLEDYCDAPGQRGQLIHTTDALLKEAQLNLEGGFQMNTHAIGDAANRQVLDVYQQILKSTNKRRWRIEHAQVLHPDDLPRFAALSVIPSVQTTHATSDMGWVENKLGTGRLECAYAYKRLLDTCGLIANGSDFPVEDINPLLGFYAGVSRKDVNGWPADGFLAHDAISREEALRAMTCWAAYANFNDDRLGSLEAGKCADFVILEEDIMTVPELRIPSVKVHTTYVRGEKVYGK
ncbi:MAG: amidohydrolase [Flavobacteriales bacterium]|nr:amidohydrolase [Flavobacteriales bacterium]